MELLLPLLFFIPFALVGMVFAVWIWALIDALQVPADVFYRSGSKVLWGVLIGVMGPLAAVVYLAAGRPDAGTRDWVAQQRAAGVDLRAYRVYDQPAAWGAVLPPGYGALQGHGPPPGYGTPPGYGAAGYGAPPAYGVPPAYGMPAGYGAAGYGAAAGEDTTGHGPPDHQAHEAP